MRGLYNMLDEEVILISKENKYGEKFLDLLHDTLVIYYDEDEVAAIKMSIRRMFRDVLETGASKVIEGFKYVINDDPDQKDGIKEMYKIKNLKYRTGCLKLEPSVNKSKRSFEWYFNY